jgi:hypothetical protein
MWGKTKIPALNIDIVSKITTNYQHVLQYRVPFSKLFRAKKEKINKTQIFSKSRYEFWNEKKSRDLLTITMFTSPPLHSGYKRYKKYVPPLPTVPYSFLSNE